MRGLQLRECTFLMSRVLVAEGGHGLRVVEEVKDRFIKIWEQQIWICTNERTLIMAKEII